VARAIEQDQFYVITHPDLWPGVESRMNAVRDAFLSAGASK
jgi:hypothetical protein